MVLLWAPPARAQYALDHAAPAGSEPVLGAAPLPLGDVSPGEGSGALGVLAEEPPIASRVSFDPVERAWFAAAGSLEHRVRRTVDAGLEMGGPNLDGPARALLLDESLGTPLERAQAAVRLAPDLPVARIALAESLWSEHRDFVRAVDQAWQAARASARHLEASLWLRATTSHALGLACLIGGMLFLLVAGGSLLPSAVRALAELPGTMPLVSRTALVAGLLLIPAALGEGLFGLALAFAGLGFWRGSPWHRVAVGAALAVSIAGLHPLADLAGRELVALGSDPVAEAAFAVEHSRPFPTDIDRLERAASGDCLVARALALHAKRSGDLEDADRRFTALIDDSASPSLLNNAANVRLELGRTVEAIELYEAAAQRGQSVAVLFNLSEAYGRIVQLDQQDLALAEAQLIDPVALAALTDLRGNAPRTPVADLPVEAGRIRARLEDQAAAREAASALRRRFAPGRLGASPGHSAVGVALVALLGWGVAAVLRKVTGGGDGGAFHAGVARTLQGKETTDPFLRMVRLTALRERQARIDRVKFALSVLVPGAAGVLSRRPILGLLGSMLFASALASWWVRDGVVVDTVSVGTGGSLLFGGLAFASAVAYLAAITVTIALRERS
jgi:tetratricopeptide (TPR) repeat protein